MVVLEEISVIDYPPFFAHLQALRLDSEIAGAPGTCQDPLESASRQTLRFLRGGLPTFGHTLYKVLARGLEVGYLWTGKDPEHPKVTLLYDMMVYPEFRWRGYGREAVEALEVLAKAEGQTALTLHVTTCNDTALSLYRELGFDPVEWVMQKGL